MLKRVAGIAGLLLLVGCGRFDEFSRNMRHANKRTRTIRSQRTNVSRPRPISGQKQTLGCLGLLNATSQHPDGATLQRRACLGEAMRLAAVSEYMTANR